MSSVASLFGVTVGDVLFSIVVFAPLFALVALGVGALTMMWSRARLRAAGRKPALPTLFIVLVLMVGLPLVSCGAGVKYSIEHGLAEAIENGGKMIGKGIVEGCDPKLRQQLGVADDAVVELAPTRAKLRELMKGGRRHIEDVLQLAYVGAVDVASYTFLGQHAAWRDLRERAQLALSKPSNKLLDKLLGAISGAARATIIGWLVLLAVLNGLTFLIVFLAARRRAAPTAPA